MQGEDTQQLFTHLDSGALMWDTRTPFLGCPTQVLTWILGVSPCVKLVQKGKYSSFGKGKKSSLQLGTLPKQTTVPHFQAMFYIPISGLKYLCAKYTFCFILIGEKRLGTSEDTRDPPPPKEGEQRTPQDVEGGEVEEVVEIVTTTGDVHVVKQAPHFTSESAQRLFQDIMWCSWDLDIIK
ncbi:hypothetical protein AB205_0132390 [Aquarana catesbeiana]|uniref:Uncharacterized protein n=1 Tax=Aquarana catesbeiana TaxID=8400 RepID=A0A2G9R4U1_AQUCT|nr:hypothetical protein AB205_0132390 [Aquarana catesbeiana]